MSSDTTPESRRATEVWWVQLRVERLHRVDWRGELLSGDGADVSRTGRALPVHGGEELLDPLDEHIRADYVSINVEHLFS
jgi:hypothetical protein